MALSFCLLFVELHTSAYNRMYVCVGLIKGEDLSGDQITAVRFDDLSEQWDRSGHGLLQQKSENTQHGQSSVVDFRDQSSGLGFLASVLAKIERIVQLERDGVGDGRSKFGEDTGLSAAHVMGLEDVGVRDARGQLAVDLQESDEGDDLVLRFDRKCGPLFRRRQIDAWEGGSVEFHGPRPVEVGLSAVSNKGGHGNTSMLDFGVSKESDGSIVSLFPKVPGSETKRIEVLDGRIQVVGQGLKVGLRRLQLCGGGRGAGGGECCSGCCSRKEDSGGGLHGGISVLGTGVLCR